MLVAASAMLSIPYQVIQNSGFTAEYTDNHTGQVQKQGLGHCLCACGRLLFCSLEFIYCNEYL